MVNNFSKQDTTNKAYFDFLMPNLEKNIDASFTGAEISNKIGLFQLFYLLVQMRNEDYASARPSRKAIKCMSDVLFCYGIDTTIMESLWPPSYNDDCESLICSDGDGDDEKPIYDGIGFMQIEGDGHPYPINRINNNL